MEQKTRKVLFTDGMSDDVMLIVTDAPKEVLEEWCVLYIQDLENGENSGFMRLIEDGYNVTILLDSTEDTFDDDIIDTIGFDESYDFSDYCIDKYLKHLKETKGLRLIHIQGGMCDDGFFVLTDAPDEILEKQIRINAVLELSDGVEVKDDFSFVKEKEYTVIYPKFDVSDAEYDVSFDQYQYYPEQNEVYRGMDLTSYGLYAETVAPFNSSATPFTVCDLLHERLETKNLLPNFIERRYYSHIEFKDVLIILNDYDLSVLLDYQDDNITVNLYLQAYSGTGCSVDMKYIKIGYYQSLLDTKEALEELASFVWDCRNEFALLKAETRQPFAGEKNVIGIQSFDKKGKLMPKQQSYCITSTKPYKDTLLEVMEVLKTYTPKMSYAVLYDAVHRQIVTLKPITEREENT